MDDVVVEIEERCARVCDADEWFGGCWGVGDGVAGEGEVPEAVCGINGLEEDEVLVFS